MAPQPSGCEVILEADCLTLKPQILRAVTVSTALIQNLPEAGRVHHFQPINLLLSESPGLTAKQQHKQHIGTETLHFELDTQATSTPHTLHLSKSAPGLADAGIDLRLPACRGINHTPQILERGHIVKLTT
jgi:hypothetical protein